MARINPLSVDKHADLKETLQTYQGLLGYVPNSVLIMQHRPKVVKALAQMAAAVWKDGEIDVGFKRLITYISSRTYGCSYSMAHAAEAAHQAGISDDKLEAVIDYRNSPLFTAAERVALDFAVAASSQPNATTDEMFDQMKQHWTEGQIVEIAIAVALYGFLNRWSDTMAVPLEPEPIEFGEHHLKQHGWHAGKHGE